MKKFVLIYHSTPEEMAEFAKASPEQKAEGMKPWFAWKERIGDHLIDFGAPLMGGIRINADGSTSPSTKEVTGYSVIQATDMAQAQSLIKGHPHNGIELHESIAM